MLLQWEEEECVSGNDWSFLWLLPWQIAGLLKDNEKIHASPAAAPTDDDSEIKKIKKVKQAVWTSALISCIFMFWECTVYCRSRAFCEAGFAGGSGKPSSRIISARLMQRAWGRGTRWCSACWTRRQSTSSSFIFWWTTSWGRCAWPPALRSLPSPTMMSAAYSSTGWLIQSSSLDKEHNHKDTYI